jgi:hypothetical protein
MVNRLSSLKLNLKFAEILHGDSLKSLKLHVGVTEFPWLFHYSIIQMIAYLENNMNVKYCYPNLHMHA